MIPDDDLNEVRTATEDEHRQLIRELGMEARRGKLTPPPQPPGDTDKDRAARRELLARSWKSDP